MNRSRGTLHGTSGVNASHRNARGRGCDSMRDREFCREIVANSAKIEAWVRHLLCQARACNFLAKVPLSLSII